MDGPRSRGYGARSGYDIRTRCIRDCTERCQGVSPGRIRHETETARSGLGALDQQAAFELGESSEQVEVELPCCRGGVDLLLHPGIRAGGRFVLSFVNPRECAQPKGARIVSPSAFEAIGLWE